MTSSPTSPTKKWLRHTEINRQFPKPKYRFQQLLKKVGDFVETDYISHYESKKFTWAACYWAWYHKKTVSISRVNNGAGLYSTRATLVKLHRERDYA